MDRSIPEYQPFIDKALTPIGVNEAARAYNIPKPTISRWIKRGLISKLDRRGQRLFISMGDIAYCAAVYHAAGDTQGKTLFNTNGSPKNPID